MVRSLRCFSFRSCSALRAAARAARSAALLRLDIDILSIGLRGRATSSPHEAEDNNIQ